MPTVTKRRQLPEIQLIFVPTPFFAQAKRFCIKVLKIQFNEFDGTLFVVFNTLHIFFYISFDDRVLMELTWNGFFFCN